MQMPIPVLAGLCTYEEAARLGYSVEENVSRMVRYAWIEKRAIDFGLYWLNPTPEWEVKEALSLHLHLDADHVRMFRDRVSEMRNPPPRMDIAPDAALDAFLDELQAAETTLEKLVGLYGVLKKSLLAAYREHYATTNPLVDHPTRRILQIMIMEEEQTVAWGEAAIAALTETPEAKAQALTWQHHLETYLQAAGGIMGDGDQDTTVELPAPRAQKPFVPDFFPRRDERFVKQGNMFFPPHEVCRMEGVSVEEKTLALMCKRALEMDVPEAMARMIAENDSKDWQYTVDMTRQLWDETRHAMMGSVYFENHGIDWRHEIPLHTAFSIRLNQLMSPLEAHAALYNIEQNLMPAKTGKRYEWETVIMAHDELARLFQDYDWADEVLHTQIGRAWLLPALKMSRDEVAQFAEEVWAKSEKKLPAYIGDTPQINWWPNFVRDVLHTESTAIDPIANLDPVYYRSNPSGDGD
jgi:hypothetical protein